MGFQEQNLCNLCYRYTKEYMSGENQNANAIANNILNLKLQIHLYVPILPLLPCQKSMTPINIAENMMTVGITDVGVPVSIMYTYM